MARKRRAHEKDIVFDKKFMNGFANGFGMPWPNLGPHRLENVKKPAVDIETARKMIDCPLSTLKQQLGPALAAALKEAEDAVKTLGRGAEANIPGSRVRVTLTRTSSNPAEGSDDGEAVDRDDQSIPVEMSIGEAPKIMGEKEE